LPGAFGITSFHLKPHARKIYHRDTEGAEEKQSKAGTTDKRGYTLIKGKSHFGLKSSSRRSEKLLGF
jgi:hypothetical protein